MRFCRTCGGPLIVVAEASEELVYCPQCGSPAKSAWRFCKRCGSEIEEITNGEPVGEKAAPGGRVDKGTATHPIPTSAPTTGNVGSDTTEVRRCPQCQSPLRNEARFCDRCGAAFGGTAAEPPTRITVKIPEPSPGPAGRVVAPPVESPSLKLGGYAESTVSETASLTTEERSVFKRFLIGALVVFALVAGIFLLRAWLSQPEKSRPLTASTPSEVAPRTEGEPQRLFPASFSVVEIGKEDQFAGGHSHAVVKLDDQALFMIRDEGTYPSTIERARAITDNLRQAMGNLSRDPQAEFRWEARPEGPTIVQVTPNLMGEPKLSIVTVLNHDAVGYNRRSHTKVTAEQLAQWWLDRLKDRVNLFVKGQRPALTLDSEDGRILAELYDRAKQHSAGAPLSSTFLYETLRELRPEQRRLLSYEGARLIPQHDEHH